MGSLGTGIQTAMFHLGMSVGRDGRVCSGGKTRVSSSRTLGARGDPLVMPSRQLPSLVDKVPPI